MPSILHQLPRTVLEELCRAFTSGRVQPPYSRLSVGEWLTGPDHTAVCQELERFRAAGMSASQIGIVLDLLAKERARQQDDADRIQMVWTGPDQEGPAARDTGVVARELLGQASKSLLIMAGTFGTVPYSLSTAYRHQSSSFKATLTTWRCSKAKNSSDHCIAKANVRGLFGTGGKIMSSLALRTSATCGGRSSRGLMNSAVLKRSRLARTQLATRTRVGVLERTCT